MFDGTYRRKDARKEGCRERHVEHANHAGEEQRDRWPRAATRRKREGYEDELKERTGPSKERRAS